MNRIVHKNFVAVGDVLNGGLISENVFLAQSIAQDELSIDTLDATLEFSALAPTLFQPKDADAMLDSDGNLFGVMPRVYVIVGDASDFVYGDEVLSYYDDKLIGKFYMESIQRVGQTRYAIACTSAMGLLDNTTHYGGIYTGQKFSGVLADIIGGMFAYTVSDSTKSMTVYGWLPIATRRDNLQQLLFAFGVGVKKDENGDPYFDLLSADNPFTIVSDRLYLGGNLNTDPLATNIQLTEHQYIAASSEQDKTLFEGDISADTIITPLGKTVTGGIVKFQNPAHSISVSNGTLLESGPNYAVLAPGNSVVVTGKEYIHVTRLVTRTKPSTQNTESSKDNNITSDACTLVSANNSEDVADRLMAYYGYAEAVSNQIIVGQERPGDSVICEDPFHNEIKGFIQSMDITMSGILKAASTLIVNYEPPESRIFTRSQILTWQSSFTVPENVNRIRIVLIGGGDGGASGAPGEAGAEGTKSNGGRGGKGGAGGQPGNGGKIFVLSLPVEPGQTFDFSQGKGGKGGVCDGAQSVAGTKGTATTFGPYSSDNGKYYDFGYQEIFDGDVYGLPGGAGRNGGKGRNGGDTAETQPLDPDRNLYYPGRTGHSKEMYGGIGEGGGGGGAAYWDIEQSSMAGTGYDGGDGDIKLRVSTSDVSTLSTYGGDGGEGAVGGPALKLSVGQESPGTVVTQVGSGRGGFGGHGGGGGGGGGSATGGDFNYPGAGGIGGRGGDGGDGFQGCAIIYLP